MHLAQHTQSQEALGGTATIGVVMDAAQDSSELFQNLWIQTFRFERQFSRFLPSSELSQFNAQSGVKVPISTEFADILHTAQRLAEQTKGLFNPFILPALQRTGYHSSAVAKYADDPAPDYTARQVVQPTKLELGDDWARIPHGTAIDLGGCGKGYLADLLGQYLRAQGVAGYWIEFSGDIATYGTDEKGQNFTISVKNATKQGTLEELIVCPTTPFGIATSGTFQRVSQVGTMRGHHIINPETGKPAETDVLLATICAGSAVDSDVLASCAIIVGSKLAPDMLRECKAVSWILQTTKKRLVHGAHIKKSKQEDQHA